MSLTKVKTIKAKMDEIVHGNIIINIYIYYYGIFIAVVLCGRI